MAMPKYYLLVLLDFFYGSIELRSMAQVSSNV